MNSLTGLLRSVLYLLGMLIFFISIFYIGKSTYKETSCIISSGCHDEKLGACYAALEFKGFLPERRQVTFLNGYKVLGFLEKYEVDNYAINKITYSHGSIHISGEFGEDKIGYVSPECWKKIAPHIER